MRLTFRSGDIVIGTQVATITVGLGRKFVLSLHGVGEGHATWTTENDPVLDLREDENRLNARVKATGLGVSIVRIFTRAQSLSVVVEVVPMNDPAGEAVALNGSIGEQEPDN